MSRADALATVTELDRVLLRLVSEQRVLSQTQLERLLADVPGRTVRYRTERLTRLELVGRSRPYRARGSAPFHHWPTRVADAFVRGEPVPRGGERPEPNPQFLAHAERLSELYVLLATQAPGVGLRLRRFVREGDAREAFRADGRARALAPDALVETATTRSSPRSHRNRASRQARRPARTQPRPRPRRGTGAQGSRRSTSSSSLRATTTPT